MSEKFVAAPWQTGGGCGACLLISRPGGNDWNVPCLNENGHDGDHHFEVYAGDVDILRFDLTVEWKTDIAARAKAGRD